MNIVNKLTIRHLKENKKRTLVTILGTIISAAMIMAVATIGVSYADLLKKEAIENNGNWHVSYKDLTTDQIDSLLQDEQTDSLSLIQDRGYAELEDLMSSYKPYIWVRGMNDEAFTQFDVQMLEGRLPETENELIVSSSLGDEEVKWSIGDEVTLATGKRFTEEEWAEPQDGLLTSENSLERNEEGDLNETLIDINETSYTIVGFFEQPNWEWGWTPGYMVLSYIDESDEHYPVDSFVYVDKPDRYIYDHADELSDMLGITNVQYNSDLLRHSGITASDSIDRTMNGMLGVIIVVIIAGSVALIFNAFAISVSERSRYLGMLSSVGATKRQKRNSVFFEGAIIGVISVPIGIAAGIVGIGITFLAINPMLDSIGLDQQLSLTVTPFSILITILLSALTIFISTWLPALRASRITAMDAIRQTHDIKLKNKTIRTSKLVRRLFGIEAELGLKNLKRNKKRYHVTVLSLIVSIVLFLSVSFFTDSLKQSYQIAESGDAVSYDLEIYSDDAESVTELKESIEDSKEVTDVLTQREMNVSLYLDESEVAPELLESGDIERSEDGKYIYHASITSIDRDSLDQYVEEAKIPSSWDDEPMSAIVLDTITYEDYEQSKYIQTKAILKNINDTLNLVERNWETEETKELPSLTVTALTEEMPMGNYYSSLGSLNIFVSNETFEAIFSELELKEINYSMYVQSDDPMLTEQELSESTELYYSMYNLYDSRMRGEQMIAVISVFTYGFVTLITLISLANILNTISTGVALRKREFAMLRSVGLTNKSFKKMMMFESAFYGVKALLYGLPLSILVMYIIYRQTQYAFSYSFTIPWLHMLGVIIGVFVIVGLAMLYSLTKTKNETIIEGLIQENQ
ncbi:FtsX-like permease family protein [Alkalicoccobacillus gibsonii]|uniref:FtsX-like permease family protein n=1 Tax=Alkalicoccobacillus gibsonii TaxID=79881 RepID=UPI003F7BDAF8